MSRFPAPRGPTAPGRRARRRRAGLAPTAHAQAQPRPCDIYAAGGTPCVAAHSTTRALYAAYNGPLYQVRRASDNTTRDIGVAERRRIRRRRRAGLVLRQHDLRHHHHLRPVRPRTTTSPRRPRRVQGPAAGGFDNLANRRPRRRSRSAATRPTASSSRPGIGYRNNNTNGIATGDQPEGMYAVFDGTHYNGGCCFDYGNAETNSRDDGNGTMETIYFGNSNRLGLPAPAPARGSWPTWRTACSPACNANGTSTPNDPTDHRPVRDRIVKGEPNHWADPRRQRAVGRPVDLLRRTRARRRLQPDEQAGRDHPRHRRRQQQRLRRHLLRRRDDLRLPVGRHRDAVQANIVAAKYDLAQLTLAPADDVHARARRRTSPRRSRTTRARRRPDVKLGMTAPGGGPPTGPGVRRSRRSRPVRA